MIFDAVLSCFLKKIQKKASPIGEDFIISWVRGYSLGQAISGISLLSAHKTLIMTF